MKISENFKHSGIILVNVFKNNKSIYKKIFVNQITDLARSEIIKPLYGATPDMTFSQLAFGDGETSPSANDTTLINELYRVADTDLYTSDTGQSTAAFYLTGTEYIAEVPSGEIKEIGFFAGTSALSWSGGTGKNTGLLVSRVLWDYTIESDQNVYIQRVDTITT